MAVPKQSASHDTNLAQQTQEWIDGRVYGGLKAAYRGSMEVFASGFGKGLLITAAVAATTIMVGAVLAPTLTFGVLDYLMFGATTTVGKLSFGQSIDYGLRAVGNFLLGSYAGAGLLAAGGTMGSLNEAWSENKRLSRDAAECQAVRYKEARETSPQVEQTLAPLKEQDMSNELCEGHCAKLLRERAEDQGRAIV